MPRSTMRMSVIEVADGVVDGSAACGTVMSWLALWEREAGGKETL